MKMLEKTNYVQQSPFTSRTGISKDLLRLLSSHSIVEVENCFNTALNKVELFNLMCDVIKWVDNATFKDVSALTQTESLPAGFQPMEKALKQLQYVSTIQNDYATKRRKYQIVLDSVSFVEADIIKRLINGNFDILSVRKVLGVEPIIEQSPTNIEIAELGEGEELIELQKRKKKTKKLETTE